MIDFLDARENKLLDIKTISIAAIAFLLGALCVYRAPSNEIVSHMGHVYVKGSDCIYCHDPRCGQCKLVNCFVIHSIEGMLDEDVQKQRELFVDQSSVSK